MTIDVIDLIVNAIDELNKAIKHEIVIDDSLDAYTKVLSIINDALVDIDMAKDLTKCYISRYEKNGI